MESRLGILHLTDLHLGEPRQSDYLSSLRREFMADLERCYARSGPWDLVIFSGDLVYSGRKDEFARLEESFLGPLRARLGELGSPDALMLAVPGNHDLARPKSTDPVARVLAGLATSTDGDADQVWEDLLRAPASPYRKKIDTMLAAYRAWWSEEQARATERLAWFRSGCLAGDFAAVIEKEGCRFGIVGLNATYAQVAAGNFEGRLALHGGQLDRLIADEPSWFESLDAAVLVTHQPPGWLAPRSKQHFEDTIAPPGRFALHLCGHLHESRMDSVARGGAAARLMGQGLSLLGLEPAAGGIERRQGYQAFAIVVPETGEEGEVVCWPRRAERTQAGSFRFSPDSSFELDQERTAGSRFKRLRPGRSAAPSGGLGAPVALPGSVLPVGQLDKEPVPAGSLHSFAATRMASPDGTFLIGRPPPNWQYRVTTMAAEAVRELKKVFGLEIPAEQVSSNVLSAAQVIIFEPDTSFLLEVLPGRTRANNRFMIHPAPLEIKPQLAAFSVGRSATLFQEKTTVHNFALALGNRLQLGTVSLDTIQVGRLPKTETAIWTASFSTHLEHLLVNGKEVEKLSLIENLYVIEGIDADYMITTKTLIMDNTNVARTAELAPAFQYLTESFVPIAPADARERRLEARRKAEQDYLDQLRAGGRSLMGFALGLSRQLIAEMDLESPEGVKAAVEQLKRAQRIDAFLREQGAQYPQDELQAWWAALERAEKGRAASLRKLLRERGAPALEAGSEAPPVLAPPDGSSPPAA